MTIGPRDLEISSEGTQVRASAERVLRIEAEAVLRLADRVDDAVARACALILGCEGRVVVTGMGKSGAIARKSAATLSSTGTPALFLHPAEGAHGDLGMVTNLDVVIVLSYSGESDEVLAVLPGLRRLAAGLIAVTGRPASTLGRAADVVLDVAVEREACPLNLAPTTSTTVMLAMLDALAVAVMEQRRFSASDFALYHPAGALGRRLLLRVSDVMRTDDRVATISRGAVVRDALFAITRAQAGCAFVIDGDGLLLGLLSDGDIRRLLVEDEAHLRSEVHRVMNRNPRSVHPDDLLTDALAVMERQPAVAEMPVIDEKKHAVGVLNLKDILQAGIL